jgi:hypothetical protein
MKPREIAAAAMILTFAVAQPEQDHDPEKHHSPYAGQQASGIAALSQQELDDLRNGAGMGLARAAELNHYPGPRHVLAMAAELGLTDEQRTRLKGIHADLLEQAQSLGARIIENESTLDRRFSHRNIDEDTLGAMTLELGHLYGELRFVHLAAHLTTAAALTKGQIDAYDRLRGYVPVDNR